MAKVYRDFTIMVGLGIYPSKFINTPMDVITENGIARILATFPASYGSDYAKIIDIEYTSASEVLTIESYEMTYSDDLLKYVFIIDRKYTYGTEIRLQFRARYNDAQESIDQQIFTLYLKPAIKTQDLEYLDTESVDETSVILQGMIISHANVLCSSLHSGHVFIDNTTMKVNEDGELYHIAELVSAEPTPSLNYFGRTLIIKTGTAEISTVKICVKNSSDEYVWIQLGTST
jgi:hypothetical protein